MSYRPLPNNLTIKNSDIEGLGLFATKDIKEGELLGISHYEVPEFGLIRTPLGGFINHSEDPNCLKIDLKGNNSFSYLITKKDISKNEELSMTYTLYDPTEGK